MSVARNEAVMYGALWDDGRKPSFRMIERTIFVNNTTMEQAAFTAYHVLFRGMIEQYGFSENRNRKRGGRGVYLDASASQIVAARCVFEGPVGKEAKSSSRRN
jgi:hypothetical protein